MAAPGGSQQVSAGLGGSGLVSGSRQDVEGLGGSSWVSEGLGGSWQVMVGLGRSWWFLKGLGWSQRSWQISVGIDGSFLAGLDRSRRVSNCLRGSWGVLPDLTACWYILAGLGGSEIFFRM